LTGQAAGKGEKIAKDLTQRGEREVRRPTVTTTVRGRETSPVVLLTPQRWREGLPSRRRRLGWGKSPLYST